MTIKIKSLTTKDYESLISLWQRAGLSHRPKGRDSKSNITEQIDANPDLFLGAFENGILIGVSVGSDDGRKGWVNRIAVDPKHRRKGVAQLLIKATEDALRKRGRAIICTLIEDWNKISLELFKKCGYVLHRDIYYLSKRDSEDI